MQSPIDQPRAIPSADDRPFGRHAWHLWLVLALTLIGAFLRFWNIGQPALWGDEAAVYWRTCATFQDLLDIIQDDGFVPLHYELYWWIRNGLPVGGHPLAGHEIFMTPLAMRFVPALASTLMIPVMFFLGRQLVGRRAALLAAGLATCSAYMLNYAHDAKMYMHTWMLGTLSIACLLWWLRSNNRIGYLGWIAAGLAAAGLHASALILLALTPVFVFTQRRLGWRVLIPVVIGMAVIGAGPRGYYSGFNRWAKISGGITSTSEAPQPGDDSNANWQAHSGLSWIEGLTQGRSGWDLTLHSTSAFLYSWELPREERRVQTERQAMERPEPARPATLYNPFTLQTRINRLFLTLLGITLALLAVGTLPWPARWRGVPSPADGPSPAAPVEPGSRPWWQIALRLLVWVVIPTYVFYCRSVEGFVSPREWIGTIAAFFNDWWLPWTRGHMPRLTRGPWGEAWSWLIPLTLVSVLLGALFSRWRWAARAGALAFLPVLLVTAILGAADPVSLTVPSSWFEQWMAALTRPALASALVMLAAPLLWFFAGSNLRQRMVRLAQLAIVVTVLYLLCLGTFAILDHLHQLNMAGDARQAWQSIWQPRYLAIIWPGLALAVAALLLRLPTRPLRWGAIALVLGANLANGYARNNFGSEPPVDRQAADIWAEQCALDTVHTYFGRHQAGASPGEAGPFSAATSEYLLTYAHKHTIPRDFAFGQCLQQFRLHQSAYPAAIHNDAQSPKLQRIIVWQHYDNDVPNCPADDPLARALGDKWKLSSEEFFALRLHWEWENIGLERRREFVRIAP